MIRTWSLLPLLVAVTGQAAVIDFDVGTGPGYYWQQAGMGVFSGGEALNIGGEWDYTGQIGPSSFGSGGDALIPGLQTHIFAADTSVRVDDDADGFLIWSYGTQTFDLVSMDICSRGHLFFHAGCL